MCIASRGNDGSIDDARLAPGRGDRVRLRGAGSARPRRDLRRRPQRGVQVPLVHRPGAERHADPGARPDARADRTQPIMFSPLDPHRAVLRRQPPVRTSDGGQSWQPISPDLARPTGAVPASVGALHPKGAEKQRGVIYALGALAPERRHALGGHRRRARVGHPRRRRRTGPTSRRPRSDALEQGDADRGLALRRRQRLRVGEPLSHRRSAPLHLPHPRRRQSWQAITAGLPTDAPVNAVREDPERAGLLFAATEKAVWVSFDDGEHWQSLQLNLPHTSMRDLVDPRRTT